MNFNRPYRTDLQIKIKIILVETSHPGNIGAVARAMKNMGLHQLVLVNPLCSIDETAFARSSGAQDILQKITVEDTLEDAIKNCNTVYAASARSRNIDWPTFNPSECSSRILNDSIECETAVVFGPEQSGLKNEHIDLCDALLYIPVNPKFSSLNLAMAVQIFCYQLRMNYIEGKVESINREESLATVNEMENFYNHLEKLLIESEFLDPKNPRFLMRRIRKLFAKASIDKNEVNILRGILTAFERFRR